jgi:hypothetical protein
MEVTRVKKGNKKAVRAAVVILLALLSGGFMLAGLPVLAADIASSAGTQNESPIAENLKYSTFRNIPVKGHFTAIDPEDDTLIYEIADSPKKGSVLKEEDGSFVYTPGDNKKGQDSFTYVAIDTVGNISERADVTITINKQSTKIAYSDMTGNGSYYTALVLAEKGILTGEKLGGEYFFRPDAPVTRGEFLAMCMAMNETKTLQGITRTGFSDDDSIPLWVKPYVTTALMSGIISGFRNTDGQLVFAPDLPISVTEAAVLLNNILNITDVQPVASLTGEVCPAWAYQAEVNLTACRILMPDETLSISRTVTRADAADMLVAAMTIAETRDAGDSLLSWLK